MSALNLAIFGVVLAVLGASLGAVTVHQSDLIFGLPGLNTHARAVRKLVHNANWTSFATISTVSQIYGFPMMNVLAVADSPVGGDSTGNIFFYLSSTGSETLNINVQNNVTALFTQGDDLACLNQQINSIIPSCSRAAISGQVTQVYQGSNNYASGQAAVLSRHPATQNWINNNNYYLCMLVVESVYLFDSDGSTYNVSVKDYYNDKVFGIFNFNEIN